MKKTIETEIKEILNGLVDAFDNQIMEDFDKDFPTIKDYIKKYCKDNPYDIAYHFTSVRLRLERGCRQFLPLLKRSVKTEYNFVITGIFDGTFLEALSIKCNHYTDMVRKFFKAVYTQLTTNEIVNCYEEYSEEEITKWYNSSNWAKEDYATLEDCLKDYVGKPRLSIKEFQTSNDIIDWYFNIVNLYTQICKVDYTSLKEMMKGND